VINASAGGVCLWLPDPPAMDRRYAIRWRAHGRQQLIGLRPVWLQPRSPGPDLGGVRGPEGWLGGFVFAPATPDGSSAGPPQDILPDGQLTVESHFGNLESGGGNPESADGRWTHLSGEPGERRRVLQASRGASPAAVHQPGQSSAMPQSPRPRRRRRSGLVTILGIGLAAAVLGYATLTTWTKTDQSSGVAKARVQRQPVPGWTAGMNATTREGWMKVQSRFGFSDARILPAIRMLKADDKYPVSHWLRDLTAYPTEVERALAILAGSGKGVPRTLGSLVKDLEMRLVSGSRFPDEPAGPRHLGGSRELEENTVVLAVLDLLRRREDEVAVRDLRAAVRRGASRRPSLCAQR